MSEHTSVIENRETTMMATPTSAKFKLHDVVRIKRWKIEGKIVARTFSPLRYDIQCAKRMHRGIPEHWLEHPPVAAARMRAA